MKKIKVLQFPIANSFGGITHYALENWKWMDKDKFQCDFATMSTKLDFENEILEMGSKIHYISCYAEENREQFIKEFNSILDEKYDVVHLHTKQWKSFLVEELCKAKGVKKVIVHAHSSGIDTFDEAKRAFELQLHECVKKEFSVEMATDFWACSEMAADFLFKGQIPKEQIKLMPNAIEIDKYVYNEEMRNELRKNLGLEDSFVIGHVGRFVYQKNHDFLIDVFEETVKKLPTAKLLLLGEGELCEEIRKKVRKLGLDDKVIFMGKKNDVQLWYQVMDVFLLPSRFEGLPIALIEAQAAGLPCIGSDSISKEVKVTKNVCFLPFAKMKWVEQILNYVNKGRSDIQGLREAGYDIKSQIKYIEQEYMR